MKKNKIFLILVIFPMFISAQNLKVDLIPFGGYMFGGKVLFVEGDLNIVSNANYGIALNVPIKYGVELSLDWSRMDTRAEFRPSPYYPDYGQIDFNMNVNYFHLGVLKTVENPQIKPYGLITAGATYFNAVDKSIEDVWRFSFNLGGGVKYYFNDRLGIRLQGRLMIPLYFSGGGFYCGIGTGGSNCGLGISSSSSLLQGDITGGLIFRLGN